MQNALLVGLSRQMALSRELDAVANNIANLNTTGFKADGTIFEEFLMPKAQDNNFAPGDTQVSFVQDRASWHDMSAGPIEQTGNPLDLAIDGNAFFVVQTPNGERYTRNGAFQINSSGQLVNSEGDAVLGSGGPIQFQSTDNNIHIAKDGTITVREGSDPKTDAQRGQIRLAAFDNPAQLQKVGSSEFQAPDSMQPQAAKNAGVLQGAIEKSNVHPVLQMSRMIEITRSYAQISAMLQNQNDMSRSAIDKLVDVPS